MFVALAGAIDCRLPRGRRWSIGPVILEDALVYSDDDRIERMFNLLHRQSSDQQILVFSCRQRALAKLGGNVLQMRDWSAQPL